MLQIEVILAWLSMLSFKFFFHGQKWYNCIKLDYKKHNKYYPISFMRYKYFRPITLRAAREYQSLLALSFVFFTRRDGMEGYPIWDLRRLYQISKELCGKFISASVSSKDLNGSPPIKPRSTT